eukprot:357723-Chlamydomonas_euryale.AAC.20
MSLSTPNTSVFTRQANRHLTNRETPEHVLNPPASHRFQLLSLAVHGNFLLGKCFGNSVHAWLHGTSARNIRRVQSQGIMTADTTELPSPYLRKAGATLLLDVAARVWFPSRFTDTPLQMPHPERP